MILKIILKIGLTLFAIISLFLLIFTTSVSAQPPNKPELKIDLDSYDEIIDTSPEVSEPMVQVTGRITLTSQTPIHVEINLTTESAWSSMVVPSNFTLQVLTASDYKSITVTVRAPLGVENNTEQTVRVLGTWSYFQGVGGGEIEPVTLNLLAHNETEEPDNGKNGDNGDDDGDKGFLPGFESSLILVGIFAVIFYIRIRRKQKK